MVNQVYVPYTWNGKELVPGIASPDTEKHFRNPHDVLSGSHCRHIIEWLLKKKPWFLLYNRGVRSKLGITRIATAVGTMDLSLVLEIFEVKARDFQATQEISDIAESRATLPITTEVMSAQELNDDLVKIMLRSLKDYPNYMPQWCFYPEEPNTLVVLTRVRDTPNRVYFYYRNFEFSEGMVYAFDSFNSPHGLDAYHIDKLADPPSLYRVGFHDFHEFVEFAQARVKGALKGDEFCACPSCGRELKSPKVN